MKTNCVNKSHTISQYLAKFPFNKETNLQCLRMQFSILLCSLSKHPSWPLRGRTRQKSMIALRKVQREPRQRSLIFLIVNTSHFAFHESTKEKVVNTLGPGSVAGAAREIFPSCLSVNCFSATQVYTNHFSD